MNVLRAHRWSRFLFSAAVAAAAALRGHVPFGYSVSTADNPLPHAADAAVMVVANQTCLSDAQVNALADYAKRGGRLVCTGESGRYDEWNRQRFGNPLKDAVAGFPNVVWRNDYDTAKVKRMTHIEYAIHPPDKGVRPLLGDIAKTGWCPEVEVLSAPETVFAQFKLGPDGKVNAVHLLNYVFLKPVSGVRLRLPAGIVPCFAAPFDETPSAGFPREVLPCVWEMPVFTRYAFCALKAPPFSLAGESQYVFPGKTSDLQALIDEASAAGGGVVTVSPGVHELRPIALKSGVTLRLERGAVLQASANLADYAARDGSPVLVGAFDATNVAVVGEGVIDGRGSFFKEKDGLPGESQPVATPVLMRLSRCCGVRLEGFTFRDAAAWGVHLRNCDGVQVRRVKAFCHVNKSNDGIDVESRNVLIEDCDLDTDDDALVFKSESDPAFAITNVAVRNCRLASCCNAIKFGTGSYGLWRDIDVHDCVVTRAARTWRFDWRKPSREHPVPSDAFPKPMPGVTNAVTGLAAIALEVVDGGRMENVRVRNIDIQSGFQTPIFIRMERRHPPMDDVPTCMRDVLIENVKGTAESRIACSITGLPYVRPTGITLRNVSLRFPGGGTAEDAVKVPRECEADYPDNYMFDQEALPAWGFYIRHADDIRFENVSLSLLSPDARPKIVREDVKDFLWDGHKVD
ncbi:MAG: hypothetical protein IJQ65_09770 [Kiritimatiellae bacterium]|nr:hypothetical protein [Kiritimatiellia bacterium]